MPNGTYMLIYVVIADYHYECCENVAIYDNAVDAEAAAEKLRNAKWEYWGPNEIYVESYMINSINENADASEGLK